MHELIDQLDAELLDIIVSISNKQYEDVEHAIFKMQITIRELREAADEEQ